MRYLVAVLSFFTCAFSNEFLSPAVYAPVQYGEVVTLEILLSKPVLDGKIIFGRTLGEASRTVLKGAIHEYGDTLRVKVTLPAWYPADDPKERDYQGPVTFMLTNPIGGLITSRTVEVWRTPPASGTGKVSRATFRPASGRSTLIDVMGRSNAATPIFFWGVHYVP